VGLAMAISIGLGALIGHYLDVKFKTEPWLFFIFLGFGIAAAFRNLYIMYKKIKDI
jgi:ATP synthase protein I